MIAALDGDQQQALTPEQERQRKLELTEELKLPSADMRSLPWFHGKISREKAEQLVTKPGDFIVRESLSQQGMALIFDLNVFNIIYR